jgi:hypothetical protein
MAACDDASAMEQAAAESELGRRAEKIHAATKGAWRALADLATVDDRELAIQGLTARLEMLRRSYLGEHEARQ